MSMRKYYMLQLILSSSRPATASVHRGRQTECPAVESPHDREAHLFLWRLRDRERARQRHCFCSKRQNTRPSKVLTTRLFQWRFRDGERARQLLLFKKTECQVLTTERLNFFGDHLEMARQRSDYTLPFRCYFLLVVSLQHNMTNNTIKLLLLAETFSGFSLVDDFAGSVLLWCTQLYLGNPLLVSGQIH